MATYLIDYENVNKDGLNGVSRLTENDRVVIFYSAKADRMTFGLHRRLNETKAVIEYRRVDVGGHNALDIQLATYLGFLISQDSSEEYCIVSNDRGFEYLAGFWRRPLYKVTRTREIATSPQAEERRQLRMHEKEMKLELPGRDYLQDDFPEETDGNVSEKNQETAKSEERTDLIVLEQPAARSEGSVPAVHKVSDLEAPQKEIPDLPAEAEADPPEKNDGGIPHETVQTPDQELLADPQMDRLRSDVEQSVSGLDLTDSDRREITEYIGRYKTKLGINNALVRHFGTQKAGEIYKSIKNLIRDKKGSAETRKHSSEEEHVTAEVKKLFPDTDLTDDDLKEIASCISRYKTRQGVNNALVRRFRSQRAGEIYKVIKPLLKDKKGRNHQ